MKFKSGRRAIALCESRLTFWDVYDQIAETCGFAVLRETLKKFFLNSPEDPEIVKQALAEWDEPDFLLYLKAKTTGYFGPGVNPLEE